MLGGSFTSRLNLNLREKHGYTYGARANFELRTVAGPFVASAGVRTDATAAGAQGDASPRSPACARRSSRKSSRRGGQLVMHAIVDAFADGSETTAYLADLVAHHLPLDAWSKLPAQLAALDLAATTRAAERHFRPDELTIVIVGDRKAIEPELRLLPFVKSIEFVTP